MEQAMDGFRIFGREPAWWTALATAIVATLAAFVVHVTPDQQATINAVAVAGAGLITAAAVARDKLLPALLGIAQAVFNLAVAYGFDLPADKQAILLTLVTAVATGFVRTQVTAKVPATAPGADLRGAA